jgi:hypothetical protein
MVSRKSHRRPNDFGPDPYKAPEVSRSCCRSTLDCTAGESQNIVHSQTVTEGVGMCRNIRLLFNFQPPVTHDEVQAASLQFVRKVSGFNKPSKANEAAFNAAVQQVAESVTGLMNSLLTLSPPRNRLDEAEKRRARSELRFSR